MFTGFSVDGTSYNFAFGLKRTSRIESSEISGMMLDKTYFNDVIGTYLEYTVQVAIPTAQELNYATFYEAITNPVAEHTFVFPYNNTTATVKGRVDVVSDTYVKDLSSDKKLWRKIAFRVTSNEPQKVPEDVGT